MDCFGQPLSNGKKKFIQINMNEIEFIFRQTFSNLNKKRFTATYIGEAPTLKTPLVTGDHYPLST
jgi:hypothetical protein